MRHRLVGLLLLALAGCSSSSGHDGMPSAIGLIKMIPSALSNHRGGLTAQQQAQVRAALVADGKPSISVTLPRPRIITFMVPYYPSKAAMVWSSTEFETVTLRDGVMTATRGFGRDIMASQAPDAALIASGQGSFHRIYEYLDGADAPVQFDFDCDFRADGTEDINVLGLIYTTRLVVEDCSKGDQRFQNRYWFDNSGKIRQSEQLLAPGKAPMTLQRIID